MGNAHAENTGNKRWLTFDWKSYVQSSGARERWHEL